MTPQSGFRADIEALRAVAVLGVFAFHLQLSVAQGGYAGVDVFFVISGYLITSQLRKEFLSTGSLNFLQFYARRVKRLVPMASLVICATTIATYFFYPPFEQLSYFSSALLTSLHLMNIRLFDKSLDYFSPEVDANPYLHFWSLAVEEQFYLVWPLTLLLILRLPSTRRAIALIAAVAASLVACVVVTGVSQPAAYYLLPFRAWEFLAGGAIAFLPPSPKGLLNKLMAPVGLLLIFASYSLLDANSQFPGWLAVFPVLGAALFIYRHNNHPSGWLQAVMESTPVQWVGGRSYAIYLWHWPVIVFYRSAAGDIGLFGGTFCLLLTFALSEISYRLVEHPIRISAWMVSTGRRTLVFCIAFLSINLSSIYAASLVARASINEDFLAIEKVTEQRSKGQFKGDRRCLTTIRGEELSVCEFGPDGAKTTVALFGDSHIEMWSTAMIELAEAMDWRILTFMKSSCPVAITPVWNGRLKRNYDECDRWRETAFRELARRKPDVVLIGQASGGLVDLNGSNPNKVSIEDWSAGLKAAIDRLIGTTDEIIVLRDAPLMPHNVPACLARARWFKKPPSTCSVPENVALSDRLKEGELHAVRATSIATYVDLTGKICQEGTCYASDGYSPRYRDGNHLSMDFVSSMKHDLAEAILSVMARR